MDQFPIRVVAELAGVPATTLRAWERRYGLLQPNRTAKGHRLYTSADLERVREVVRLLDGGLPIREAAQRVRGGGAPLTPTLSQDHWGHAQRRMLRAIEGFDEGRLDALYNEALSLYPVDLVTDRLLRPLLQTIGERWQGREAGIAEEHFFTGYLRNKIGARLHHEASRSRGRRLLLACLPDELHELGLLLFALAALGRGYRILYLGSDLPLAQIPTVVERAGVAAVLLSGTIREPWAEDATAVLQALGRQLPVPLLIGGDLSSDPPGWLAKSGAETLGAGIGEALERLEALLPAHTR